MEILIELLFQLVFRVPIFRMIALAVVPALLLLWYVRKKDWLEPEPPKLIWSLVGFGALAVLAAMLVEVAGLFVLSRFMDTDSVLFAVLQWFVVVGLGEEFCKFMMLRLRTWKNEAFNCTFDAMVYAVAVSAGFALAENIMYAFRYGFGVVFLRAITSIPAHICFSVFMGAWYSAAKKYDLAGDAQWRRRASLLAVGIPALAHGAFDFIATNAESGAMVILFIVYLIAMFIVCWRLVKRMSENDTHLTPKQEGINWDEHVQQ